MGLETIPAGRLFSASAAQTTLPNSSPVWLHHTVSLFAVRSMPGRRPGRWREERKIDKRHTEVPWIALLGSTKPTIEAVV